MKTNTIKAVLSAVVTSAIIALAATKVAASYFDLMAIGVGYSAVAMIVAMAIFDSRRNEKGHAKR